MDQAGLAFLANVSPRSVFAVEKGKQTVRLDVLIRVLNALGMTLKPEAVDPTWRPSGQSK
jgi:transcriptional regulator with XRE-family HTH domain